MGYLYAATVPKSGKSKMQRICTPEGFPQIFSAYTSYLQPDRIHRTLRRRMDAAKARRLEAALSAGSDDDFAAWNREVLRINKLTRALTAHLSRR